ncbi:hypothetical protein CAEBREN_26174 [Caenorhabditis brenneri]|uniref:NTF2-like domain-containing protein n=1 Tax=Caenorhabditis brenneri TaxID=135651 RepID=G0NLD9_CAEBE|nr:hypothetical protein CAEBREN_26174 [Caenorhabditis brenneri]
MKFQVFIFFFSALLLLASGEETKKPEDVDKGEKLVQSMLKGIELKNEKMIGDLFENDFVYAACENKTYKKEDAVKLVTSFGIEMAKIMEKSTKIISIGRHKFITIVAESTITSEFIVSKNWKLKSGRTVHC